MKLFEDQVYEGMDWLEAACQPIHDNLNEVLAKLPDSIEVTPEILLRWGSPTSIYVRDAISSIRETVELTEGLSYRDIDLINDCYEFKSEGHPIFLADEGIIKGGSIMLVKVKHGFDEKETEQRLFSVSKDVINRIRHRGASLPALNEMTELLGLEEARKSRSKKDKVEAIKKEMLDIMSKNRWMIRDMELSNKVGTWVECYVEDGNLAALSNFCKLKVMTHKGQPIYSIAGEEKL